MSYDFNADDVFDMAEQIEKKTVPYFTGRQPAMSLMRTPKNFFWT